MKTQLNTKLIGTKAYPVDNSYQVNLKTKEQSLLAEDYHTPASLVTIVSEPYILSVKLFSGLNSEHEFVTVLFENELYICLNDFSDNDNIIRTAYKTN